MPNETKGQPANTGGPTAYDKNVQETSVSQTYPNGGFSNKSFHTDVYGYIDRAALIGGAVYQTIKGTQTAPSTTTTVPEKLVAKELDPTSQQPSKMPWLLIITAVAALVFFWN